MALAGLYALPQEWTSLKGNPSIPSDLVTESVKRGPFKVSVVEKGTIDSSRNTTLTSSVEGSTTIISIVPEGSLVKAGDIVCELDSSALQDKARQQEIQVTQADAALAKAEEDRKIQVLQNESDIAKAQLDIEFVELDFVKFDEGENKQKISELKGMAALKEEDLKKAEEKYAFSKGTAKKGYITQNQLEADRISVQKAQHELNSAKGQLRVYEDFQQKRLRVELEENRKEFKRQIERVKAKNNAAMATADAEVAKNKLTAVVEKDKMERWQKQIAACVLRAPNDGEVVYANEDSGRRGNGERVIEEGATVHERQAIIKLPDNSHMKVDSKIHESRISQVRTGLAVSVSVDAIPGVLYRGVVESVSSVPLSGNWMQQDLKEYECNITITDKDPEKVKALKSGMTAKVEILVNSRSDVLQAPVQAVVQIGEERYAFVATPENIERRTLKMGQTNDVTVEILDGVKEGERVVLNPRTAFAKEILELEAQAKAEKAEETEEAEAAPAADIPAPPGDAPKQGGGNRQRRRGGEGGGAVGGGAATGANAGPGAPGAAGGQRPAFDPAAIFARLDKNSDGSLTQDEVQGPMADRFSTIDADSDGKITPEEMNKAMEAFRGGQGGEGGERSGRRNRSSDGE